MTLYEIYEKRVAEGNNKFTEQMMLGKMANAIISSGYTDEEVASLVGNVTSADIRTMRGQKANKNF